MVIITVEKFSNFNDFRIVMVLRLQVRVVLFSISLSVVPILIAIIFIFIVVMLTEVKVKVLMLERCLVMMGEGIMVANCHAKIGPHTSRFDLRVVSISMFLSIGVMGNGAINSMIILRRRNAVVVVNCSVSCMSLTVRSR